MSRHRGWALGCALVLVACSNSGTAGPDGSDASTAPGPASSAPVGAGSDPPASSTSPASTGDATVPSTAGADTTAPEVVAGDCSVGTVPADGAVTYVAAGRLIEIDAGGVSRCLAEIAPADAGPIRWSPDGTRVLLGGATVADLSGQRASGYFPQNTQVVWSAPTGKSLIAPSVNDGGLVKRSSTDASERLDVSFLADTTAASYHPAGRAIVAAGVAETGIGGIFLASNVGKDVKTLATYDNQESGVDEVAFDQVGDHVFFLHHHADGTEHVHQLDLPGLGLATLYEGAGKPVAHLAVSSVDEQTAAWQLGAGSDGATVSVAVGGVVSQVDIGEPAATLEPIGWLAGHRLVVVARPAGNPDGPGSVWIWSADGGPAQHVVDGAERVAVRVVRGPYQELPDQIAELAPG